MRTFFSTTFGEWCKIKQNIRTLEQVGINDRIAKRAHELYNKKVEEDERNRNDPIIKRICELYSEKVEKQMQLLYHLAHSVNKGNNFEILKIILDNSRDFTAYCEKILEQVSGPDEEQYALDNLKLAQYISHSTTGEALEKWADENKGALVGAGFGVAKFWYSIPPESQKKIIVYIGQWASKFGAILPKNIPQTWAQLPQAFGSLNSALVSLGTRAPYALTGLYLTYEFLRNIYKWYKGEISGKRVVKNLIDVSITTLGGVGGGIVGALIGSLFTPIGIPIGGLVGGIVVSVIYQELITKLTTEIFDLPKEVAVENAYNYLGISHRADILTVNSAYKRLCLTHHPDKGGSKEEFVKLQSYMGIIKVHRGEVYE